MARRSTEKVTSNISNMLDPKSAAGNQQRSDQVRHLWGGEPHRFLEIETSIGHRKFGQRSDNRELETANGTGKFSRLISSMMHIENNKISSLRILIRDESNITQMLCIMSHQPIQNIVYSMAKSFHKIIIISSKRARTCRQARYLYRDKRNIFTTIISNNNHIGPKTPHRAKPNKQFFVL